MKKSKKVLIIGGGFAGCATAYTLNELNHLDVTLVEKGNQLGAGVRTQYYGGHPYTFGPRHILTKNKEVYKFLNNIVPMRKINTEFLSYVEDDNEFYSYPLNMDDVNKMPEKIKIQKQLEDRSLLKIKESRNMEDYWINSVGEVLYNKVIKKYNQKMWQVESNKEIDTFHWSPKGATIKDSSGKGDKRAWTESISAYPIKENGYNDFFDQIPKLKTNIVLNSNFKIIDLDKKVFDIDGNKTKFDIVISSISPDSFFDNCFGELGWIGRDFHKIVLPKEHIFPANVYFLYYCNDEAFTRIVEYKKFTRHKSKNSLIGLEIPSKNGKHYPLPFVSEIEKSMKYINLFPEWFFSIGRAGTYRYQCDIDDCIEQAFKIKELIEKNEYDGPMPVKRWENVNN
jgi:UDP-galactopyranose mutase